MRILFLLILFTVNISAFTEVSGPVEGIWNKQESPYIVTADIYIPQNSSLKITEGTEVLFNGRYKFTIEGSSYIQAIGTEEEKIHFRHNHRDSSWYHIEILNSNIDTNIFEYCVLINGNTTGMSNNYGGALYSSNSIIFIENSLFEKNVSNDGGSLYLTYCLFSVSKSIFKNNNGGYGGAIYFNNCKGNMILCDIIQNSAIAYGGGIYCAGEDYNITISDSKIKENYSHSSGGGVLFYRTNSVLANCIVENNYSNEGGGVYLQKTNSLVINNRIENNISNNGGGIFSYYDFSPKIINNTITGNYAEDSGGGCYLIDFNNLYCVGNIISDNECSDIGGGIAFGSYTGIGYISNNTIIKNKSYDGGGLWAGGENHIYNNIIWDNISENEGNQVYLTHDPSFYNCNIEGSWEDFGGWSFHPDYDTYINCLDLPPNFADSANGDFSLTENSPCIDAGFPDTTGLFLPQTDIAGMPRISGENIDIGAFEFQQTDIADDILSAYYELSNSPNPFNPETVIRFYLERSCHVELSIYNVRGQKVATLQEGKMSEGFHFVRWRASEELGTGLYLAVLTASDKQQVKKMMLMK